MPTSYLDRGPGRVAYDVQGDGPLVLCLPGMGDLRSAYRFLVPALVDTGYRVATMDLRGHGDSDDGFDAYDNRAAGADALALVEHLGGGSAVLVGNSMCAAGSVWASQRDPAKVAGLVLIAPFMRAQKMNPFVMLGLRLGLARPWGPAFVGAYYRKAHPGHRPADLGAHIAELRASYRRGDHWRSAGKTIWADHVTVEDCTGEVPVPALVVMGTRDPDFADPTAEAREVAARLRTEPLLVDGAGHYPMAEYPEIVNPAVIAFLTKVHARA